MDCCENSDYEDLYFLTNEQQQPADKSKGFLKKRCRKCGNIRVILANRPKGSGGYVHKRAKTGEKGEN